MDLRDHLLVSLSTIENQFLEEPIWLRGGGEIEICDTLKKGYSRQLEMGMTVLA